MKTLGIIDPLIPVNTFLDVIFIDDYGKYYKQIITEGKISSFEPIGLCDIKLIYFNEQLDVNVGCDQIICFSRGNQEVIVGCLKDIISALILLLVGSEINLFAKIKISSFLSFHGFTSIFIDKCNDSFIKKKIKCTLNKNNFILTEKKNYRDLPDIINKIEKCKLISND